MKTPFGLLCKSYEVDLIILSVTLLALSLALLLAFGPGTYLGAGGIVVSAVGLSSLNAIDLAMLLFSFILPVAIIVETLNLALNSSSEETMVEKPKSQSLLKEANKDKSAHQETRGYYAKIFSPSPKNTSQDTESITNTLRRFFTCC